ncbi:MAG: choice-of-anchor L domain-containing protein, partial [Flavobacteriales bacterium]|nr:choice-of-anchor L domain-containing protein [Flavobacteriales bacterium]
MKILQIIVIVLISTLSNAQVNISNTGAYGNPSYLVNNVLAGTGVTASNITFTGNNAQIGFFDSGLNGLPNLGLDSGIVISSGDVLDIAPGGNQPDQGQYNAPGDTNLLSVAKSVTSNPNAGFITDTYDAAALEFDFIPVGDTVRFEFVFASEEYTTYINTQFNDVFAFFLSGPGITGPYESPTSFPGGAKNVALVPGTSSPITISTIYNDPAQTPTQSNGQYYVSNFFEQNNDFNGFTTVLVAQSAVQCGQLYHFKFAIADCGDDYLDTGVFLKANSLTSSGIRISVTTPFPDSTIVEGCGDAIVKFERSDTINNDTLHLNFSGTANSSDYDGLPNPIIFPKDSTSIAYALSAELDDESESTETLQIEITGIMGCNGTSLKIENYEEMSVIVSDSINICSQAGEKGTVSFSLDGGKEPFNYEWEDIVNGGFFTADNES